MTIADVRADIEEANQDIARCARAVLYCPSDCVDRYREELREANRLKRELLAILAELESFETERRAA